MVVHCIIGKLPVNYTSKLSKLNWGGGKCKILDLKKLASLSQGLLKQHLILTPMVPNYFCS